MKIKPFIINFLFFTLTLPSEGTVRGPCLATQTNTITQKRAVQQCSTCQWTKKGWRRKTNSWRTISAEKKNLEMTWKNLEMTTNDNNAIALWSFVVIWRPTNVHTCLCCCYRMLLNVFYEAGIIVYCRAGNRRIAQEMRGEPPSKPTVPGTIVGTFDECSKWDPKGLCFGVSRGRLIGSVYTQNAEQFLLSEEEIQL